MSFSRAAEELFLTQPAVSIQVKQLEEHFGIELFAHVGRRIVLTPAGREMLGYARTIIENFRAAEAAMVRAQGAAQGVLRVGVERAGSYVFPRVIAAFAEREGRVDFDLAIDERETLLSRLAENELDLAIVTGAQTPDGLETRAFAPHPFVLVASASHPLANQAQIACASLGREPLIAYQRTSSIRSVMEAAMPWHAERFEPSIEIADTEAIKQCIAAGMGIGFLSAHCVSLEVQSGTLAILDVERFPHVETWRIAQRVDRVVPPVAQEFRRFLLKNGARGIAVPCASEALTLSSVAA